MVNKYFFLKRQSAKINETTYYMSLRLRRRQLENKYGWGAPKGFQLGRRPITIKTCQDPRRLLKGHRSAVFALKVHHPWFPIDRASQMRLLFYLARASHQWFFMCECKFPLRPQYTISMPYSKARMSRVFMIASCAVHCERRHARHVGSHYSRVVKCHLINEFVHYLLN